MKIKKLNTRGFSHHFVMALIVLIVAVGGTYYLVASHADNTTPVFSLSPSATSETLGSTFTVGINFNPNGNNFSGVEPELTYPAGLLQCMSIVSNPSYFPIVPTQDAYTSPAYPNNTCSNGVIALDHQNAPGVAPINTPGLVATATFKVIQPGSAAINFTTSSEARNTYSSPAQTYGIDFGLNAVNGSYQLTAPTQVAANFAATDDQTAGTATSIGATMSTGLTNLRSTSFTQVVYSLSGPAGIVPSGAKTVVADTFFGYSVNVAGLPNGTYHLTGTAYTAAGPFGTLWALDGNNNLTFNVDNTPTAAPAAPTNLRATTLSNAEIGLSWTPVSGAASYNVYRNGTRIANVGPTAPDSATADADTGLASNTTYSYYVTTLNAAGQQSAPSNTAVATTKPVTITPPPVTTAAEELSIPPQRRPAQYLSMCADGKIGYVSDNTSNCWAGGSLLENYSPSVSGTYYNVPCVEDIPTAAVRFVYIASGETCPSQTTPVPLQLSAGEQASFPPATRPSSYLTVCGVGKETYVALGSCVYRVPNSVYQFTYTPPQPGTYYDVPCATITQGGLLRYLYISSGETCPENTFGNLFH